MELWAHSHNEAGKPHKLADHLLKTAQLAEEFAQPLGAGAAAYVLGLLHDAGKSSHAFQAYIRSPGPFKGPDHSSAGALLASKYLPPLAFIAAGHHAGLANEVDLRERLSKKAKDPDIEAALETYRSLISAEHPQISAELLPTFVHYDPKALDILVRLLFSCLIDADRLDSEAHDNLQISELRRAIPLDELWAVFSANHEKLIMGSSGMVNVVREEVYRHCLAAAIGKPGIYRLTVPTGGGKTRAVMGFALKHAQSHNMKRVIMALPYTSIIDQTVDVYRSIWGDGAVLEHHSGVDTTDDSEDQGTHIRQLRLATENWDAPVIVTTTVQLLESLHANKSSRCRKLHNIANSVVILDEVQTLPSHVLAPILYTLQQLVDHYKVTVVLCTATQPALDESPFLKGLRDVKEIIPAPTEYFHRLQRVEYELLDDGEPVPWALVADRIRGYRQSLTIVNTKADAVKLLDLLPTENVLHLSTSLCGKHRRKVLNSVKEYMKQGQPCTLISTQVVEAGVDLDFPVVLRAMGPLDRIVQAAGRCNREGKLYKECGELIKGQVIIFNPESGGMPRGAYRVGTEQASAMLASAADLHSPTVFNEYFKRLYQAVDLDRHHIQDMRGRLRFRDIAEKFSLIGDDTFSVVIRYGSEVDDLVRSIPYVDNPRSILRRLQPYIVSLYNHRKVDLLREGLITEITENLYMWEGVYDCLRGVVTTARDPEGLMW